MAVVALIDGDEVIFKAVSVASTEVDWDGDGEKAKSVDLDKACVEAEVRIKGLIKTVKADRALVCLSDTQRRNFRKKLLKTYKPDRAPKPPEYWEVVDHVKNAFRCMEYPYLEADDVMGFLSNSDRVTTIIVSSDKDMKTIPGYLYDPYHDKHSKITPLQADRWWLYQTLIGDVTDGFGGCPRVGPVNAEKILNEAGRGVGEWWPAVVAAYERRKLDENAALVQARMARILRRGEYNQDTGVVKLWHPVRHKEFDPNES